MTNDWIDTRYTYITYISYHPIGKKIKILYLLGRQCNEKVG